MFSFFGKKSIKANFVANQFAALLWLSVLLLGLLYWLEFNKVSGHYTQLTTYIGNQIFERSQAGGPSSVSQFLKRVDQLPDIQFIGVYGPDEKLTAYYRKANTPGSYFFWKPLPEKDNFFRKNIIKRQSFKDSQNATITVNFMIAPDSLLLTNRRIIGLLAMVLFGVSLLAILYGERSYLTAMDPVFDIRNKLSRVLEKDDYKVRIEPNSYQEVGQLSMVLNDLIQSFSARLDRLNSSLEDLESSIHSRTSELSSTNRNLLVAKREIEKYNTELIEVNKRHEKTIQLVNQLAQQAEESSISKSQFLANMSHEIRTPMNGIIGFARRLKKSPLSDRQREYVDTLYESSESLMNLLDSILNFSKIEAKQMGLEKVPFNFGEVIRTIVNLFKTRFDEKRLEFECEIKPGVAEYMLGDPLKLKQILINLLSNSIKFTDSGKISVTISQLRPGEPHSSNFNQGQAVERLLIEVKDTGIGIPEDKLKDVFEVFSQADTSVTRVYGGTGLGLSIVKSLVQMFKGEIAVESTEGVGSTFLVLIPMDEHLCVANVSEAEVSKLLSGGN